MAVRNRQRLDVRPWGTYNGDFMNSIVRDDRRGASGPALGPQHLQNV